jgi:hypothetical protein
LAKTIVSNDPRPICRTNIVKICVRYISTRILIIRFHISGEYSSENSFLCLLKSSAKRNWTYITLCERHCTHSSIESQNCASQTSCCSTNFASGQFSATALSVGMIVQQCTDVKFKSSKTSNGKSLWIAIGDIQPKLSTRRLGYF